MRRWPAWAVAAALFLLHALVFGRWIIDDAGISFAYARNLAAGHGLVSQPGMPPVEGFSNPLWVLLLAPWPKLGLGDPTVTAKLLSVVLVLGTFALLESALTLLTRGSRWVPLITLLLLAVNSCFVIWTVSGLENPLYAFLLCLLLRISAGALREGWPEEPEEQELPAPAVVAARSRRRSRLALLSAGAGAVAALLAMTRPDGAVFCTVYPLLVAGAAGLPAGDRSRRVPAPRRALACLGSYGAAFVLLGGAFLGARYLYFGELVPNTFHAKGGPGMADVLAVATLQPWVIQKTVSLFGAVSGPAAGAVLLLLVAGCAYLAGRRMWRREHGTLLVFAAAAALVYLLLPPDWMPGFRFATPFLPAAYAFLAVVARSVGLALAPRGINPRFAARMAMLAAVGLAVAFFGGWSLLFAAVPTVPFASVARDYGLRFNRYAAMLGVGEGGSILLPDLGGTLWTSRLRVFDLAGLCDKTIARTLRRDSEAFHDYIFERVRPTFIHTHEYWTAVARFDEDPRFRRDYVPLDEAPDPWVRAKLGAEIYSGDYLRRDVAELHPAAVSSIREELARARRQARPGAQSPARGPTVPDARADGRGGAAP